MLALSLAPSLLKNAAAASLFSKDAQERATEIVKSSGSLGAYSESKGVQVRQRGFSEVERSVVCVCVCVLCVFCVWVCVCVGVFKKERNWAATLSFENLRFYSHTHNLLEKKKRRRKM